MADLSCLASINPEAYTALTNAKTETLNKFNELISDVSFVPTFNPGSGLMEYPYLSRIPGFVGDVTKAPSVFLDEWSSKFSELETNIMESIGLDRKSHMREFLMVANGYAQYYGEEGLAALKEMSADTMLTLNGFTETIKAIDVNYFLTTAESEFNSLKDSVSAAAVQAYESTVSKLNAAVLTNTIMTDAINNMIAENKDLYEEILGFKGCVGL